MNFCITGTELRKAIADIKAAEKNGFNYCLAVFRVSQAGPMLSDVRADYSDLIERSHPTDGHFDWGRFQNVSGRNKFVKGKLIPISK